jgi:hypothetical protein
VSADLQRTLEELKPFEHYPFASFVKGRPGGDFKRHKTLPHARNATNSKNVWNRGFNPNTDVYEWDDKTKTWLPYV